MKMEELREKGGGKKTTRSLETNHRRGRPTTRAEEKKWGKINGVRLRKWKKTPEKKKQKDAMLAALKKRKRIIHRSKIGRFKCLRWEGGHLMAEYCLNKQASTRWWPVDRPRSGVAAFDEVIEGDSSSRKKKTQDNVRVAGISKVCCLFLKIKVQ